MGCTTSGRIARGGFVNTTSRVAAADRNMQRGKGGSPTERNSFGLSDAPVPVPTSGGGNPLTLCAGRESNSHVRPRTGTPRVPASTSSATRAQSAIDCTHGRGRTWEVQPPSLLCVSAGLGAYRWFCPLHRRTLPSQASARSLQLSAPDGILMPSGQGRALGPSSVHQEVAPGWIRTTDPALSRSQLYPA